MGRQPCCDKVGLKRGPWTIEEDQKLMNFILNNGIQCWRMVPKLAGLLRCGKSCRLRWINYLRPDLKRGALSEAEENQIIELHSRLGNRWSKIASHFPGRTDNEIKNHWNTRIKKKLKVPGLDYVTHKPTDQQNELIKKVDEDIETITTSSTDKQEKILDVAQGCDHQIERLMEAVAKESEAVVTSNMQTITNDDVLSKFEILCESLDMELLMNQEADPPNNSYSPSFSLEDLLNPSIAESSSTQGQEDFSKQWVDSVESMLSWDCFNQLQEEFFLLDKS